MATLVPTTQRLMAEHLRSLGWKEDRDFGRYMRGAQCFTSPRWQEFCVTIEGDSWELGEFTDSDVDGYARARYKNVDEGEGRESLDDAIQARVAYSLMEETHAR